MNRARPRRSRIGGRLAAARRLLRSDRGSSAIELAILAPMLLILTMIIIQFALWFQAREAALAAAQEGARDARVLSVGNPTGWQTQVVKDTRSWYDGLGTKIFTITDITPLADDATGMASVTVTGQLQSSLLSMFGPTTITVKVQGPQECFRPAQRQGGPCG